MAKKQGRSVLVIPDLHIPYHHPQAISFLDALDCKYNFDTIINLGDEIDGHSISVNHDKDPELFAPSDEFDRAIFYLKDLYAIFPRVSLVESNHGSLVYRKLKQAGLPVRVVRSYNEILEAPKGWKWTPDLTYKLPNDDLIYFCHGKTSTPGMLSKRLGINAVQGHFHEKFHLTYWKDALGNQKWDCHAGCLINQDELAFDYAKYNLQKPMLGALIIIECVPYLIPMTLDRKNRWIGKI